MWVGLVRAPVFVVQHLHGFRQRQNAVVGSHLVESTLKGAFGAGAIVTADIDDQRIIKLAFVLNFLDDAANLMIGVGSICGEDFSLARVKLLLDQRKRVPSRQLAPPYAACPSGHGVSWVSAGITPSRFWFAKISSRNFS